MEVLQITSMHTVKLALVKIGIHCTLFFVLLSKLNKIYIIYKTIDKYNTK